MNFADLIIKRRSIYDLSAPLPVAESAISAMVEQALLQCPTAFNSQSGRIILLFGADSHKLWQIVQDRLKEVTPPEHWEKTKAKIAAFAAGSGTVLYFIDDLVVAEQQKQFPLYADKFPLWAEQSIGILQYMVWALFAEQEIGASLQHYNPLIDIAVQRHFKAPPSWRLCAQMPFGGIGSPAENKSFLPLVQRLKIFGQKP